MLRNAGGGKTGEVLAAHPTPVTARALARVALAALVLASATGSAGAQPEAEVSAPGSVAAPAPAAGERGTSLQSAPAATIESAPEPALELHYDVYYSLLRLVTIASESRVADRVYSLTSRMETVGLLGALFPWTYRSEVHGRITDAELRPDTFNSHSEVRDRVQQVSLRYDETGPLVDTVTPFDASVLGQGEDYTRDEVSPEMRAGTIDPLTEIASVSQQLARGQGCAGVRSVFDGLRRYDVIYEDLGETELEESSYDAYEGRARQCRSRIKPIAGFWKPKEEKGESITSITAWLMPPVPGADPVPVRIAVEGARGTLSIHLTKVSAATS